MKNSCTAEMRIVFCVDDKNFMRRCVQKAIQIRQSPFSADSCSDSSDIDEPNGLLPSMSCSRDRALSSDSRHPLSASKLAANHSVSQEGSCSSLASETSSDYAFPPEDGASVKTDNSDLCLATTTAKPAAASGTDSYKKVCFYTINIRSHRSAT